MVARTAARAAAVVAAVIGVLMGFAAVALIEAATEFGRAAREDAAHGPVMVGVKLVAVGTGVGLPMLTEEVCEVQGHRRDAGWETRSAGEGVECFAAFALADLGEVKIAHDFLEGAVAEVSGDLSDGSTAFQHVGAVTVAQGVGGEVLVFFG